jgi:steroid delta-isomerase-like uncharacterized protein
MGNARDLMEGFGRAITGDREELDRVCSPDIDFSDSMDKVHGIDALQRYLQVWTTAFPDAKIEITSVIESGDRAAGEIVYSGTHTGTMAGPQGDIPATGRTVQLPGCAWIEIKGGKIAAFRGYYDGVSMMAQLGLLPAPATA